MLKLEFQNAVVKDSGYGLEVNGKSLEGIISTALGVKAGDKRAGYGSNIPEFSSTCCNVTVIIDPQPITTHIEDNEGSWDSVKEMEEDMCEQFKQKNAEADPES